MGSMSLSAWPPLRGDSVIWRPRMDCPTPQLRSQGPGKWMATWKLRFGFLWNLFKVPRYSTSFQVPRWYNWRIAIMFSENFRGKNRTSLKAPKEYVRYQNIEGPQMAGTFFGSRVENRFLLNGYIQIWWIWWQWPWWWRENKKRLVVKLQPFLAVLLLSLVSAAAPRVLMSSTFKPFHLTLMRSNFRSVFVKRNTYSLETTWQGSNESNGCPSHRNVSQDAPATPSTDCAIHHG